MTIRQLLEKDLIYLAGFLDGDGSIMAQFVRRADYRFGFQIRLSVQFSQLQKRRMYLEQFQELIGAGYIRDSVKIENINKDLVISTEEVIDDPILIGSVKESKKKDKKPMSHYVITSGQDVYEFLTLIYPHLRMKQKQAKLCMTIIEGLDSAMADPAKFIELCKLVDEVSALNDSKTRVITAEMVIAHVKSKFKL